MEAPVWVHEGFLEAYTSVRSEVLRLLETAMAGDQEPWTLYITGHSLGAALSTLCSFDCARRTWRGGAVRPHIVHYNYGSPRVGNKAFAEEFDRLVPNAWRVANSNDAVTLVPRMLGYCHVGHRAQLEADGGLQLLRNSSQAVGEGADMGEVALAAAVNLPMLTEQLLAKQEELAAAAAAAGSQDGGDGSSSDGSGTSNSSSGSSSGGGSGSVSDMLQQNKPMLMSAAGAVAAAATAMAGAGQQAPPGGSSTGVAGGSAKPAAAAAGEAVAVGAAVASTFEGVLDVQTLLEEEIRAMSCLLDGSAIDEHLEPLYLENIRLAIDKLRA